MLESIYFTGEYMFSFLNFELIKNIAVILSTIIIISVFIYSMAINSITDSFKKAHKSYTQPMTIIIIFKIVIGLFYGIVIYFVYYFFNSKVIMNTKNGSSFDIDAIKNHSILYTYIIVLLFVSLFVYFKYQKKYKDLMYTNKGISSWKHYDFMGMGFASISGAFFILSFIQNNQKDRTFLLISISLLFFIVIFVSGMFMGLHYMSDVKEFKFYINKKDYFDEKLLIDECYIKGFLISEDNDEYIIKIENQPAIRIKKNLVDIIQPVIDENEGKEDQTQKEKSSLEQRGSSC